METHRSRFFLTKGGGRVMGDVVFKVVIICLVYFFNGLLLVFP